MLIEIVYFCEHQEYMRVNPSVLSDTGFTVELYIKSNFRKCFCNVSVKGTIPGIKDILK